MKKLLPILMLLIGLGAGAGVGWVMQPAPPEAPATPENQGDTGTTDEAPEPEASTGFYAPAPENTQTIRLPNQFVVPLIDDGQVRALVVIGVALELDASFEFSMTQNEPRLRAIFLQLLFDHANLGGFDGVFTSGESLLALRRTLREAARLEIGTEVSDVLITELVRQDS